MTTQSTRDRADADLRALLAQADPEAGTIDRAPAELLDRVLADVAADPTGSGAASAAAEPPPARVTAHPSWLRRHWQGAMLAAASAATFALAASTVLPGLAGGGSDEMARGAADSAAVSESAGSEGGIAGSAPDMAAENEARGATSPGTAGQDEAGNTLVRWGSMLVGTEDVKAGRDAFVATVLGFGGRVTSESVVTEDGGGGIDPSVADSMAASRDMGMTYPYPWYPTGPGVWLTVQVPVEKYDQAIEAARATGEVVQMQQSSYDVGSQIADVDARIAALEASLARLTALMDEADGISDVIALEAAIAQRQSELDSLRAQQRELANQTAMSQISLTLMSPEDARQTVDPQPDQSWWESFLEGLGQFWTWLGSALLIVSPLLIAAGIIAWARRRQRRRGAGATTQPAPGGPAGPTAQEQPTT